MRERRFSDEHPPFASLLVAAVISFVLLVLLPTIFLGPLLYLLPESDSLGPMSLPIVSHNVFLEALVGSGLLTIISLIIVMAERWRRVPRWLPFALSLPVATALILPSALEHGGPFLAWLAFCVLVAAVFCVHWRAFTWARTIWD
jgi:hypothetical protein